MAYCLSEDGTLGGRIRNIKQSFLAPGGNSKRYHPVTKHLDAKGTSWRMYHWNQVVLEVEELDRLLPG